MIQLYDKFPPELGLSGGMCCDDSGEYCKAQDAQQLLNKAYAQIEFLLPPGVRRGPWNNYRLPPDLRSGVIYSSGVAYCLAQDAQRLLNHLRTEVEYAGSHIPNVGCARETWNKPVRC